VKRNCVPGLLAAAQIAALLAAGVASAKSLEELERCAKGNLPERSSVQRLSIESVDRRGSRSVSTATVYWRRFDDGLSRVLLRVTAPDTLRGAGVLMLEKPGRNDLFMYLPDFRKVRRVTTRMVGSSLFGTDFSNEDFERMQGIVDRGQRTLRAGEEKLDGRSVQVVEETLPEDGTWEYSRVLLYVDPVSCLPLRIEGFDRRDTVRKVIEIPPASIQKKGEIFIASEVRAEDMQERTHSVLRVEEVEFEVELADDLFSQRALEQGH
jgi:hypothetical protein